MNRLVQTSAVAATLFFAAFTGSAAIGAAAGASATVPTARPRRSAPPLLVGWHDEMNDASLWKPYSAGTAPDIFAARPGAITLRLPHVPDGFPYSYQWGGMTREVSVDLGRYPVLVAYVSHVGDGSYAHLDVAQRDYSGRFVHTSPGSMRSPTLLKPGLTVLDLGQAWETSDVRRFQVRLIVGGALAGASNEYAWVRFVRREDVARLQENPDLQHVRLQP